MLKGNKECFVIMPFGGEDKNRQRYYLGVYQSIIVPAALKAGYEPKRADIDGGPGNIPQGIIRDLANADLVIADLTEGNANVFFELGARHAFKKSGTVHIIDPKHAPPFDVGQYRYVEYSTDLAEIPATIDRIVEAIKQRESRPEKSDNPVHDALPTLPLDIMETGGDALNRQVNALQAALHDIEIERNQLKRRLAELDPGGSTQDEMVDIDKLLDEADTAMRSTGQHVLLHLKRSLEQGGSDQFVGELRTVLRSPYLTPNDFVEISNICRQLDLLDHRRATLEVGRQKFPGNDQIQLALISAYDDSPIKVFQDRGRLMVESFLGISREDGTPKVEGTLQLREFSALGLLFNFYFRNKEYDWVLSVTESAEKAGNIDAMIFRSKARALAGLGKVDEAIAAFQHTLEMYPNDDMTLALFGDFLDDLGRFEEAYEKTEAGVVADPKDGDRYLNLVIQILNRKLIRDPSGNLVGPVSQEAAINNVIPLVLRALEVNKSVALRKQTVSVLVRADAVEQAEAIAQGQTPEGSLDNSGIRHIDKLVAAQRRPSKAEQPKSSEDTENP